MTKRYPVDLVLCHKKKDYLLQKIPLNNFSPDVSILSGILSMLHARKTST